MRRNGQLERRGERLGQRRLAHAGHVLDEQVALGQQADQRQPDRLGLALDRLLDVGDDRLESVGEQPDLALPRIVVRPRASSRRIRVGAVPAGPRRAYCRSEPAVGSRRRAELVPCGAVTTVLAVDIGGTKLAVARVADDGAVSARHTGPTPATSRPRAAVAGAGRADRRRARRTGPVDACGCGCGGPMAPGGARSRRSTSRRGAASPCATGSPTRSGWPRVRRQRRQGARPRRGVAGRGAPVRATSWPWSCRPASAAGSCSTAACSTARLGNAGHIGHVIVEPDGPQCACGARGCLEAVASGPAIARRTGAPPAERAGRTCGRRPAATSAGGRRAWPTCSTCGSPWSPARSPSASATTSSRPPQAELDASCPARLTPSGARDRAPPGWAPTARSSARRRWRSHHLSA